MLSDLRGVEEKTTVALDEFISMALAQIAEKVIF